MVGAFALALVFIAACGPDDPAPEPTWTSVVTAPGSALLAVHGTAADDVWAVGANDGGGPLAIHYDGAEWTRTELPALAADLWWVHATEQAVYAAGTDGTIIADRGEGFLRMSTPGLGADTVFGLWAAADDDLYAVGARAGRNGFIWHSTGEEWTAVPIPADAPTDSTNDLPGLFKVWGTDADNVWIVGGNGLVLRGNARDGFQVVPAETQDRLFTVHAAGDNVVMVGGSASGVILAEEDNQLVSQDLRAPLLQGVCVEDNGDVWAVGASGSVYRDQGSGWQTHDTELSVDIQSLHAVWVDPDGGVWAVGGDVLTPDLSNGVALYRGNAVPTFHVDPSTVHLETECPDELVDPVPEGSIARRWNEQLLNSVRRDIPRPTVHARNLFHASIAMWDAWSAYDPASTGYLTDVDLTADDVDAAREEAISYATYRVLSHRYASAVGGQVSQDCYDRFMGVLGYDPAVTTTDGDAPAAVGNRIGNAIIDAFANDGANEQNDYVDPTDWAPDNPVLIVDLPGTRVNEPTRWQQLVIAEAETQNGIPEGSGVRGIVGSHWGAVTPFALERPAPDEPYLDIGNAPHALDDTLVAAVVQVLEKTAELDISDGVMVDISPAAYGNNPLGSDDGGGYDVNPITGEPYAPELVLRGDFSRILAEFWADGPKSETPPGHWNTLANHLAEHPDFERRLFGEGPELDPLAWDVHLYLTLNGAVHDAAIAAWELKRMHETARPITLIRYMGGLGQRSQPDGPAYDPDGLPLVDNLIEVVTAESSAPGERHAHLARYVGEIAVRSWRGEPGDRDNDFGGIDWIRAVEWMPYQRRNFVTPSFPGYVSGHSTFSRSAAEVLTQLTGSEFFPGGLGGYVLEPGFLVFEAGPSMAVHLQWARFYDAADQAGQSRLWGGIHVVHDDYDGRRVGDVVGQAAVTRALQYFAPLD